MKLEFECDKCDFKTHTAKNLWTHKNNIHGEKKYCHLCDYKGSSRGLRKHMFSHTNYCKHCNENIGIKSKEKFRLHYCIGQPELNNDKFLRLKRGYCNLASQPDRRLYMLHKGKMCCKRCKNENLKYEIKNGGLKSHMFEVDHIVALKDGGDHSESNLQLLCRNCHKIKSSFENKKKILKPKKKKKKKKSKDVCKKKKK